MRPPVNLEPPDLPPSSVHQITGSVSKQPITGSVSKSTDYRLRLLRSSTFQCLNPLRSKSPSPPYQGFGTSDMVHGQLKGIHKKTDLTNRYVNIVIWVSRKGLLTNLDRDRFRLVIIKNSKT
ncbi:hypothetical protein L2E82_02928 [Cichorium intybus]|uniref:Uncharacterized protein n=1 Tax=Cichorium intybus TaxID=13427 RepID=A0ACB9H356_CICIN|nr:hypothetical protein L2E82_51080 [Cichorium intybus]KAI3790114.1 hypothetical protein L2E82_02928 [Cichorium intybus]